VFEVGPDGIASTRVGETDDPAVLDAAASCPMAAIAVQAAEEKAA
jgi:ferredoxin